ncbi:2-oxoacid:acceptor oxidoreductase subunit alpha [Thermoplasma sp. Kam2015]|uniref:2-oxoacid:acceptor oxidoreductase subunit alpha n=1 Tax=Thermoplasma sp. Kam2015 TaxID=2094122 RepID=UPI001F26477C|nr:2-oxoacid:acceptor oxidoreductase subunit alpha [Thermoplasma sp. Kam2015]
MTIMRQNEVIIRVAGAAGDGVQSAGEILVRTFARSGLYATSYNYYQDIIRGGESWYQVRASDVKVKNQGDGLDILVALNQDGVERHTNPDINEGGASPLGKDGIAIFDNSIKNYTKRDTNYCPMPLADIAAKYSKNTLLKNTVGLGAAIAASGIDFNIFADVIRDQFGKKGDIAELNVKAAKEGYDYFLANYKPLGKKFKFGKKKYMISGGMAVALGAVAGGLKMYVAYPMTPASSALHFLAQHAKKYGVFVKIPEDEISAINTVIGANYAGVRAMTGSSGGGFALMTEAVGLSGMTEVPLVIYEAQRPGPSTGLPTKTEQGDLNQVLGASQGDFPRIVFAPGDIEEAFYLTREAMNIAEKYQTPVFIMSDLYLAEHYDTIDSFDLNFTIDHGLRAKDNEQDYKRYLITETGISPRAIPGQPGNMHNEDSDEHNEYGDVVSDAVTNPQDRIRMMQKRMRKMDTYIEEMRPTPTYHIEDAEYVIIQWGSTKGTVEEAVDILRSKGIKIGAIEVKNVFPLNPDIGTLLKNKKKIIAVENNYSGQLSKYISAQFLVKPDLITKYDGEAFYPNALADEIEVRIGKKKEVIRE